MQLHELRPTHKLQKRKRVGRGGSHGTYSGRGMKGQKSRAGRKMEPLIRKFIKRYPKLRGYRFKPLFPKPAVVDLEILERAFKGSEVVNPMNLLEKGIIRRIKGKAPEVKILSAGKLTKPLIIENCRVSKKAKEMIEKAGGKIKPKVKSQKSKV